MANRFADMMEESTETFDEEGFREWYSYWSKKTGINANPNDPKHKYNYRAAYAAGVAPEISPKDNLYHWPSEFKAADHPNRFVNGIDTITGKAITSVNRFADLVTMPDPAIQERHNKAVLDMAYNAPQAANWELVDRDDYENKGNDFEQGVWGKIKESFGRGRQGWLANYNLGTALVEGDETVKEKAMLVNDKVLRNERLNPIEANWFSDIIYSGVRTSGQVWETIKRGGRGAAIAGGAGAVIGGVAALALGGPTGEEAPAIAGGAAVGLKIGAKLGLAEGAAIASYRQGLGEMYYEQIRGGADPEIAQTVSAIASIPYALSELAGLKAVTPNIKKALAKKLQGSMAKIITEFSKKYGKGLSVNVAQEMVQKAITITAKDTVAVLEDNDVPVSLEEVTKRLNQIYEEGKGAIKGFALIPLPSAAIETGIEIVGAQKIDLAPVEEKAEEKPAKAPSEVPAKITPISEPKTGVEIPEVVEKAPAVAAELVPEVARPRAEEMSLQGVKIGTNIPLRTEQLEGKHGQIVVADIIDGKLYVGKPGDIHASLETRVIGPVGEKPELYEQHNIVTGFFDASTSTFYPQSSKDIERAKEVISQPAPAADLSAVRVEEAPVAERQPWEMTKKEYKESVKVSKSDEFNLDFIVQPIDSFLAKIAMPNENIKEVIPKAYSFTDKRGKLVQFDLIKTETSDGRKRYLLKYKDLIDAGAIVDSKGYILGIKAQETGIGLGQRLLQEIKKDYGEIKWQPPISWAGAKMLHRFYVKQALSENRPVPRAVLEEYKSEKWAQEALAKFTPETARAGEGEKAEGPARDILGGVEPIQQINKALREAKSIRPKLEAERKAEKSRRVGRAIGALKSGITKGKGAEQSIFASTGLLKGQLSDQRYESIRPIMEAAAPGSVDNAFKSIYENKTLQYFQVLDTADAFRKLIDGEPITLREVDLIKAHFGQEMGAIAEARAEVSPWLDRIVTLWKAGLLTGIKTSGLNMMSNFTHGITETMKDAPAALIDSMIALYTKERKVVFTTRGLKGGIEEGVKKGWDYLKTGISERDIEKKYDYHRVKYGNSPYAKAIQVLEETVFHLLGAEDQPFYYGAKAHSIVSQAIAAAKTENIRRKKSKLSQMNEQEFDKYVDELIQFPSDDMIENSVYDAEMAVFQNRTLLGDLARQIQKSKIGEVIVPFGRTPSAVAMQIVNYTPVGVVKEIIEQIHNKQFDQRKFSQAFGRSAVGIPVLAIGAALFASDMITLDYPDSERERKLWELEGRKSNSIRISGKWRSIFVLGPIGNVLMIGGYFQKALEETGSPSKAIHTALAGGAKSFSEQTFVSGVNRAVEAIQDPERSFENFFSSMAGSVVPTIVADFARAMDYTERRTQGAGERIASRVPGWRETLEPRLDVFGQDVPRYGGNPLEVMLDPTRPSKIRRDEVVDEIRRLWDKDVRIAPTELGTVDGYKILTPEENTTLWRRAGQLTYRALFDLIEQPYYKTLNDEAKGKQIEKEVKEAKDLARAEAAKVKLNQGNTPEELREDGLVTNDVERLLTEFEIVRK